MMNKEEVTIQALIDAVGLFLYFSIFTCDFNNFFRLFICQDVALIAIYTMQNNNIDTTRATKKNLKKKQNWNEKEISSVQVSHNCTFIVQFWLEEWCHRRYNVLNAYTITQQLKKSSSIKIDMVNINETRFSSSFYFVIRSKLELSMCAHMLWLECVEK